MQSYKLLPLVVMPSSIAQFANKPYRVYGGNITQHDSIYLQSIPMYYDTKHILCFIGGFCDTYYKVVWDVFCASLWRQTQSMHIIDKPKYNNTSYFTMLYISFNCYTFLHDFFPKLLANGYRISVIAHSWGAKNIVRLCLDFDEIILTKLITLDCVGHFNITHRPKHVYAWENIYITDYLSQYSRANIAAIIGGAKQHIRYADINTGIPPPAHHASVATMLHHAQLLQL